MKTLINPKRAALLLACITISVCSCATGVNDAPVRVAKFKGDKACAISYTYDDGMREHYTLVFPEMEKRNMKGTFWINGVGVNVDESNLKDTTRVSWDNLKEMAAAGHEISNHGWSHKNFNKISMDEVKVEIAKNDSIILEKIGIPSHTFCYPYNARSKETTALASEGRVGTRTRQHGVGKNSTVENLDQWVATLMDKGEWGIAMIHGITYGYDAFTSQHVLWKHFDRVNVLRDHIWVATFREVAAYEGERNSVTLDVEKKKGGWTITPTLSLDRELFTEALTMVIDVKGIKKLQVKQDKKRLPVVILSDKATFDFNPYGGNIEVNMK